MRVFLTGSSGFIGSHLLAGAPQNSSILAQHYSHKPDFEAEHIVPIQMDYIHPDLTEVEQFAPDVILHVGAITSIVDCKKRPSDAHAINVDFTRKLAELARNQGCRFVYTSTDLAFDGTAGNYSEADAVEPLSVYAQLKVEGEVVLAEVLDNLVVARCALVYGKAIHGRPNFTENLLVSLKSGQPFDLFEDEFRTPVLANELAAALWELCAANFCGTIHMGGAERVSRYEMGRKLCDRYGFDQNLVKPVSVESFDPDGERPRDCSFDINLAQRTLRTTLSTFEDGIRVFDES